MPRVMYTCPSCKLHCPLLDDILFFYCIFFFFFRLGFVVFAISWAAPALYGGSQARGPIRAVATAYATALQSHRNPGSEPCLQLTPQLTATPNP